MLILRAPTKRDPQLPGIYGMRSEEIEQGWIGPPKQHSASVPFQVRPGNLEPKPGGRKRLVWNASWPALGSIDSAVEDGTGRRVLSEPNVSTVLPPEMEFEWSAIETNNEVTYIMAAGERSLGAPMLGRTFDIKQWFRQLSTATLDRWKCQVHAVGASE